MDPQPTEQELRPRVLAAGTSTTAGIEPATGELEAAWTQLAERCDARPFRYPALVHAWATAFASGPLAVATVRRGGTLAAVMPLMQHGTRISSIGNWHTVETGLLAEDAAAAQRLAETLFEQRPDSVRLELLHRDDANVVRGAAQRAGYRTIEELMVASPYRELEGGFDDLLAAWRSKPRREQQRLRRRLGELGELTTESYRGTEGWSEHLDELIAVEQQGWKAAAGTAIAQDPSMLRFYRAVAAWAAQRGWLRIDALRLDGRPIGMAVGLEADGVYYALKMGSDPALDKHGPGSLLMEDMMRTSYEHGLRRVELLGDNDPHKRKWCPATNELVSLHAFAPSGRGHADLARLLYGRPLARRLRARVGVGRRARGSTTGRATRAGTRR